MHLNNAAILSALRSEVPSELVNQAPDGTIVVDLGLDRPAMVLGWSDPEDEDDPAGGVDWVDWTVYAADPVDEIEEQDGGTLGAAVNRVQALADL